MPPKMCAEDTAPLMRAFLDTYSGHATEAPRLARAAGERVALCVEDVTEIVPEMKIVGKTIPELMAELDPTAFSVRTMMHHLQTHDPDTEGVLVLQFDPSTVESAIVRVAPRKVDE